MMRTGFRAWVFLSLLLCWLVVPAAASAAPLRDFSGHVRSIHDYAGKGKWLVVMIWASDCSVCNEDVRHYVDFQAAHHGADATVLGISVDGRAGLAQAKAFVKRHSVNFPNLIGEPQDVGNLYMSISGEFLAGTPAILIYNPQGKPVAAQLGAVPVRMIEQYIKDHSGKHDAPARAAGGSEAM